MHYVTASCDFDNPHKISEWKRRNPFEIWTAYFERLTKAAESRLFDIIAHADLCKKFGFYPKEDCTLLFTRFLKAAKQNDVAIELNTSGLRKECKEIYPSSQILKLAAQLGIPITFGSDAHAPDQVGMAFNQAIELARSAGYNGCCRFAGRKRQFVTF